MSSSGSNAVASSSGVSYPQNPSLPDQSSTTPLSPENEHTEASKPVVKPKKVNPNSTLGDEHARFHINPYALSGAPFIVNIMFDLVANHGSIYHPDAEEYLLETKVAVKLSFPYPFKTQGANAKIGNQSLERAYAEHAQAFLVAMRGIAPAVFAAMGFSWEGAWEALVAKETYRPGRPPSFSKTERRRSYKDLASMLYAPEDVLFFCIIIWAGWDALKPEYNTGQPLNVAIPDLYTRRDYTTLLRPQFHRFLLEFFSRERDTFGKSVKSHIDRTTDAYGARLTKAVEKFSSWWNNRRRDWLHIPKLTKTVHDVEALITHCRKSHQILGRAPSPHLQAILDQSASSIKQALEDMRVALVEVDQQDRTPEDRVEVDEHVEHSTSSPAGNEERAEVVPTPLEAQHIATVFAHFDQLGVLKIVQAISNRPHSKSLLWPHIRKAPAVRSLVQVTRSKSSTNGFIKENSICVADTSSPLVSQPSIIAGINQGKSNPKGKRKMGSIEDAEVGREGRDGMATRQKGGVAGQRGEIVVKRHEAKDGDGGVIELMVSGPVKTRKQITIKDERKE